MPTETVKSFIMDPDEHPNTVTMVPRTNYF